MTKSLITQPVSRYLVEWHLMKCSLQSACNAHQQYLHRLLRNSARSRQARPSLVRQCRVEGLCDSLAPRAATATETALVHSASLLVGQDISIPKVRASMCSTEASRTPTNDFTLSPEVAVGVVASLYNTLLVCTHCDYQKEVPVWEGSS